MRTGMLILRNTSEDAGDAWHVEGPRHKPLTAKDAATAVAQAVELLDHDGKVVLQVIEFPNRDGSDFGLLYRDRVAPAG